MWDLRYVVVKPACISVGDIVELQVSFIMVPLRDNKFKIAMVLRSILVLDRTYTQVNKFLAVPKFISTHRYLESSRETVFTSKGTEFSHSCTIFEKTRWVLRRTTLDNKSQV